jgi:mannose-1-phosphate guanylyltransferase / phosphomannomutase
VTRGMQAVVMAGGEGSRLRPLTSNMPKPMLPVANRPLIEHILELLRAHGTTDVVVTVQFLASVIRNYLGDGSDLGLTVSYSTEEMPLGTAGSVLNARDLLGGPFVVVSGDALTDLDLGAVVDFHRERGAAATLVLKRMEDPLEFGIVMTGEGSRIERFLEKPTWGQVFSDTVNTGIYVLEPDVLDLIPADQPYDFSSELFPLMLDKGLPLFGYVADAYWTDVGTTDAYLHAHYDVLAGRVRTEPQGFELRPGVWVGEDVEIDPTARVEGPAIIGDNSRIHPGARVGPYSVIGDNVVLGDEAAVSASVVMDRAHLGALAQVRSSVLGRSASLGKGVIVEEGAVLGDEVSVGAGALIKPRVKIYPSRSVEAGAIVTQSVVRERRASRSLFGSRGVSGVVNVGVTPQVAVRVGMAYGTMLKRGSVVVTGRDASRAARTMKRAVIAGLTSTGVTCHDLELMPLPVTRFAVRNEQAAGGVSFKTSARDDEIVEIRLFDSDGTDLPETTQRKVDRIFFREDFRRPGHRGLGELEFPPHVVEQYAGGLVRALDVDAVRRAGLKVVVDYAYGPTSLIGPSVLGRLGCDVLALNAFTDEHRPTLVESDLARLLRRLSDQVGNSGADVGVLLEPGGEIAHLVDDRGRALGHSRALLAFLGHETARGAGVAVPVSSSMACERLAAAAGAKLVWTPTAWAALMARATRPEVGFAGNAEGALIWPRFMPAPDALLTFGKALELVATSVRPLGDLVDDLPQAQVVRREVRTPWQLKGAVMRRIASLSIPGRLMLLDGVKVIEPDRWALVIPHPEEPLCVVWAEAGTAEESAALASAYVRRVESIVAEHGG